MHRHQDDSRLCPLLVFHQLLAAQSDCRELHHVHCWRGFFQKQLFQPSFKEFISYNCGDFGGGREQVAIEGRSDNTVEVRNFPISNEAVFNFENLVFLSTLFEFFAIICGHDTCRNFCVIFVCCPIPLCVMRGSTLCFFLVLSYFFVLMIPRNIIFTTKKSDAGYRIHHPNS